MGRLVIAHHKSYHPYKADNIEKVRKDEEEARLKEAKEEGRLRLADSEARIELLRKRAGIRDSKSSKGTREDDAIPEPVRESLKEHQSSKSEADPLPSLMSQGHINLFADIENHEAALQNAIDRSTKKKGKKVDDDDVETDRGYRLAPSEADRTPWYTKSKEEAQPKMDPGKRDRDEMRKQRHDPLKEVEQSLSRMSSSSKGSFNDRRRHAMEPPPPRPSSSNSLLDSRLQREQSERERAAALISRRRREKEMAMRGGETPTTVAEEDDYGNMYNRGDVEAARRSRDDAQWRSRVKHWDGTEGGGRKW